MDQRMTLFRALSEDARSRLNHKRAELKQGERLAWEIDRAHALAFAEDKRRGIMRIKAARKAQEAERAKREQEKKAPIRNGQVDLRNFEAAMLGS